MSGFQLEHLQTLVALVDEGTFDAAARSLHLTPSAVSQRVRAMEQVAGTTLVQRSNPVRPTAPGDVVLRYARQVLLLAQDTEALLGLRTQDHGRTSMAIAVNADSLATWFLDALVGLPAELGVVFDIRREDQDHSATLLRSGTVMAAVTATAEAVQGCSVRALGSMRYRAVGSPALLARSAQDEAGTPLWRRPGVPVVLFDRKDDLQDLFLRRAGGPGAQVLAPRHYVPTSDAYAQAVLGGLGWGLLPEQQCGEPLATGALVDLAPRAPVDVALYWQRWSLGSALLDAVTDAVVAAAATQLRRPRVSGARRAASAAAGSPATP